MTISQAIQWCIQNKYLVLVHLIAMDHLLVIGFQAAGNTKATSFFQKVFLFLSAVAQATQTVLKNKTTVILISLMLVSGVAHADLFNPVGPGTQGKYKQFLASVNAPSGSTLQDITTIIDYLGATAGQGYNGRLKQMDTTIGATVISIPAYNLAFGAETLTPPSGAFIDGWAETNEWNIGNYLAGQVSHVPILQYITYAYIGLDFGEEANSKGHYQFAPLASWKIKLSFGPQGS